LTEVLTQSYTIISALVHYSVVYWTRPTVDLR